MWLYWWQKWYLPWPWIIFVICHFYWVFCNRKIKVSETPARLHGKGRIAWQAQKSYRLPLSYCCRNLETWLLFLHSIAWFNKQLTDNDVSLTELVHAIHVALFVLLKVAAGYKRISDHTDNLASLKKRRKTFNVIPRKSTVNLHKLSKPRRPDNTVGNSKTHKDETLSMR